MGEQNFKRKPEIFSALCEILSFLVSWGAGTKDWKKEDPIL